MDRVNEKLNEFKIPIGLLLVGGVLLVGGLFSSNLIQKDTVSEPEKFPQESIISQSDLTEVKVDVAGAVNSPGVFSLDKESRIEDAIKLAGGFNANVDKEFVSAKLNLAQKVSDGLKVYIPFEGDPLVPVGAIGGRREIKQSLPVGGEIAGVSAQGKIGVNSADQASLETLPGIGAVTAKKIMDNRPYSKVEELLSKKAVSKSVYAKILELVDLN